MTTSTPLTTPVKSTRALTSSFSSTGSYRRECKKASNTEFDEQIKQLEIEGSHLLIAASNLSDSLGATKSKKSSPGKNGSIQNVFTSSSLAALADISEDQKTIADLCAQLDAKSKEAESMTRQLMQHQNRDNGLQASNVLWGSSSTSCLLDKLDIPYITTPAAGRQPHYSHMSTTNNGYMLHDIQDENIDLRTKLSDALAIADKQKEHFRNTVDDLRRQLESAVATKDAVIRAKDMEVLKQQDVMTRLQKNIEQLEHVNGMQEQHLKEVIEGLETQHRENRLIDVALDQLKGRLRDQELKRRKPFNENVCVTQQDVPSLIRTIDRCIQELDSDVTAKTAELEEISTKISTDKNISTENEKKLEQEFQNRLADLVKKHSNELENQKELNAMVRKQVTLLEEQSARQKDHLEHQLQLKANSLSDVENRFSLYKEEVNCERLQWQQKKDLLENSSDETQRVLAQLKVDHASKIQELANLQSRLVDYQNMECQLKTRLDAVSCELNVSKQREEELIHSQKFLDEDLKQKNSIIKELEQKIEIIRHENDAQLKETVLMLEKEGEQNSAKYIQSMSIQINALTEKCHKLNLDLELTRSHQQNLVEKHGDLKARYETVCDQLLNTNAAKDQLNAVLSEKLSEIRSLTIQSVDHTKAAETALAEVASLRSSKDRLLIQLEEREKNFVALKEQNENLSAMLESHGQMSYASRKDKDESERRLLETAAEMKVLQMERNSLESKLKHLENVEADFKRVSSENLEKRSEVEKIVKARDKLNSELQNCKFEIASLRDQVETLKRSLEHKEGNMGKELSQMSQRLKAAEHELRISRQALKTHQEVDGKAVNVASRMQREVTAKRNEIDSLHTKIRLLEESLDASEKEKKALIERIQILLEAVHQTAQQRDLIAEEHRTHLSRHAELQSRFMQLETAMEKAASQQGASKSELEHYVQDIARLKLKHQLELKELERSGQNMRSRSSLPPTSSCQSIYSSLEPSSHHSTNTAQKILQNPVDIEYPISIKPPLRQHDQNDVGSDLQNLIREMKSIVFARELQEDCYNSSSQINSSKDDLSTLTQQNLHRNGNKRAKRRPGSGRSSVKSSSSVYDLLVGHDNSCSEVKDRESKTILQSKRSNNSGQSSRSDTSALCHRLEKKIESLSKISGKLQKENQDMSKGVNDHGRKISRIKKQIRT